MGMDAAFATLGLAVGAQPIEITRAFRALSRASHPDRGGDRTRFEAVVAAYRALQRAGRTQRARHAPTPAASHYTAFLRDLDRAAAMVITPVTTTPTATTPDATTPVPTGTPRPPSASGARFAEVLERELQRFAA